METVFNIIEIALLIVEKLDYQSAIIRVRNIRVRDEWGVNICPVIWDASATNALRRVNHSFYTLIDKIRCRNYAIRYAELVGYIIPINVEEKYELKVMSVRKVPEYMSYNYSLFNMDSEEEEWWDTPEHNYIEVDWIRPMNPGYRFSDQFAYDDW